MALHGAIPPFIHIGDGKLHDLSVLEILPIEAGWFYGPRLCELHAAVCHASGRCFLRHWCQPSWMPGACTRRASSAILALFVTSG